MPVYNGAAFVEAAVQSILDQSFGDLELVIVDDGSTDETPRVLERITDPRVRILTRPHEGMVEAPRTGVAAARADWVARMDADDIAVPHRLELQMTSLLANPRAVLCLAQSSRLDPDHIAFPTRPTRPRRSPAGKARFDLCYRNPGRHATAVFRKEAYLKVGGYRPEEKWAEDFSLFGRLASIGEVELLLETVVLRRRHPGQATEIGHERMRIANRAASQRSLRMLLDLGEADALRAANILHRVPGFGFREWLWFLAKCAPRCRPFGAALLAELTAQTWSRFPLRMPPARHRRRR